MDYSLLIGVVRRNFEVLNDAPPELTAALGIEAKQHLNAHAEAEESKQSGQATTTPASGGARNGAGREGRTESNQSAQSGNTHLRSTEWSGWGISMGSFGSSCGYGEACPCHLFW